MVARGRAGSKVAQGQSMLTPIKADFLEFKQQLRYGSIARGGAGGLLTPVNFHHPGRDGCCAAALK